MSEIEVKERSLKEHLRKVAPRIIKATVITAIVGVCLLMVAFVIAFQLLVAYPEFKMLFMILIWATIFFTFTMRVTDGTIYRSYFIVGRAFFLIIYFTYATNGGVLILNFEKFHFTVQFTPLLALVILINLIDMARGILGALQFTSASPMD